MRLFTCQACQQTTFFENVRCTQCGHTLAYLPDVRRLSAIEVSQEDPSLYVPLSEKADGKRYRLCANSVEFGACNWAVLETSDSPLCDCCRLNDIIPDLTEPSNLEAWSAFERSKRRLFYTLQGLGLPIESRAQHEGGLLFSFMADSADGSNKVFTGHTDGLITINIAEADDPFRERLRKQLGESYRTVLGHFRHEIGHYYWDRLVRGGPWLDACRAVFGDETYDYAEAIKKHYSTPPAADWPQHYVSSYATMHPWEDWAETWAHYLHMVDTLETASGYDLSIRARPIDGTAKKAVRARDIDFDCFDDLLSGWLPLTVVLNSLNRSMGLRDPYPFVLTPDVIEKLRFVHEVIEHAHSNTADQAKAASAFMAQRAESKENAPAAALAAPSAQQHMQQASMNVKLPESSRTATLSG